MVGAAFAGLGTWSNAYPGFRDGGAVAAPWAKIGHPCGVAQDDEGNRTLRKRLMGTRHLCRQDSETGKRRDWPRKNATTNGARCSNRFAR